MFAYVRYFEKNGTSATASNKKKIISTDEIKSFNLRKYKKNIKYKLKECDNEVEILFLEDTKKMLLAKISNINNKRVSGMPAKLLISASSESEGDVRIKKKKDVKQKSVEDTVDKKLNEFIDSSTTQKVKLSNPDSYQIGNDIWLSENEYNGLLGASKRPSQLAANITTLVFTVDELLTSNRTGFKSRRSGIGKEKCGKLDSVKLAACEGYYKYWIQNIYTQVTIEDAKNLTIDLVRYSYYAGKKIADLKKIPAKEKNSKCKTKKKISKEIEHENIKESDRNNFLRNEAEISDAEYEDELNDEERNGEEKNVAENSDEEESDEEENNIEENDAEKSDEEKNDENKNYEDKNYKEKNDYEISDVSNDNKQQADDPDNSQKTDEEEENEDQKDLLDPLFINMSELHSASPSP